MSGIECCIEEWLTLVYVGQQLGLQQTHISKAPETAAKALKLVKLIPELGVSWEGLKILADKIKDGFKDIYQMILDMGKNHKSL